MTAKVLLILPMVITVSLYASSPAENSLMPAKNQAKQKQTATVALSQQSQGQKAKPDSPKTQTTVAKVEPQQKHQNSTSQLNTALNASAFKADMTFEQAIDALRNSTKPSLQIVVLWRQLEQAGVNPYTPIKTGAVYGERSRTTNGERSRTINGLSVRNNLNILLASVSAGRPKLAWSERDNIIVIGLKQSNGDKKTCLYKVVDLTSAPSNAFAMSPYGYGNQAANTGFNNTAAGGSRLQQSAYGGVSNFNTPITTMNSGVSLGVGGGGGMGGGGFGGMGVGGMGFGGMGLNYPIDTPIEQQIRQQQLKTLLQSTVAPGTWQ